MEKQDNKTALFYSNGCVTEEGIYLFLANDRESDEYKMVAGHLAECELCSVAAEGYRLLAKTKKSDETKVIIRDLNTRVKIRAKKEKVLSAVRQPRINRYYYLAAAGFLLIMGLMFVFNLNREQVRQPVLMSKKAEFKNPSGDSNAYIAMNKPNEKTLGKQAKKTSVRAPFAVVEESRQGANMDQENTVAYQWEEADIVAPPPDTLARMPVVTASEVVAQKDESKKEDIRDTKTTDKSIVYEIPSEKTKTRKADSRTKNAPSVAKTATETIQGTYEDPQEYPSFPGGEDSLFKYLAKNLKFPKSAADKGIQGTVWVACTIRKDGSVQNVVIRRSLEKACDEEAVRLIKAMPEWKPGKVSGKNVDAQVVLPVKFSLP